MSAPFREDLVALLEDFSHSATELSNWLKVDKLTVIRELRSLESLGVVARHDAPSGPQWALTGKPVPARTPPRPVRQLRQPPAPDTRSAQPSWWVGLDRSGFSTKARQEFETRLTKQKVPHKLYPGQKELQSS